MTKKQSLTFIIIIAFLVAILVWLLLFWNPVSSKNQQNSVLSERPIGGDFVVQTKDKELSLESLRGKVVLMYMGYTQCPDICPTSLALLSQALHNLNETELTDVNGLFISVDPDRDTLGKVAEYTGYFHSKIIGSTADKAEIDRIAKLYGSAYRMVESDSAMGYIVDHSSNTYVIDKTGKLRYTLTHGTPAEKIVSTVRELLAE